MLGSIASSVWSQAGVDARAFCTPGPCVIGRHSDSLYRSKALGLPARKRRVGAVPTIAHESIILVEPLSKSLDPSHCSIALNHRHSFSTRPLICITGCTYICTYFQGAECWFDLFVVSTERRDDRTCVMVSTIYGLTARTKGIRRLVCGSHGWSGSNRPVSAVTNALAILINTAFQNYRQNVYLPLVISAVTRDRRNFEVFNYRNNRLMQPLG
jgi:hypothetical protein